MILVEEWIKQSLIERQSHLRLEEKCVERGGNSTVHRGVLAQFLNTNLPPKINLCHACNNDKCSNPRHLYWGTGSENVRDAKIAGTRKSPWEYVVAKYGLEEASRMMVRPKEHYQKMRKISRGRGETGDTQRV